MPRERRPRTRPGEDPHDANKIAGVQRSGIALYPEEYTMLDQITEVLYGKLSGKGRRSAAFRAIISAVYDDFVHRGLITPPVDLNPHFWRGDRKLLRGLKVRSEHA